MQTDVAKATPLMWGVGGLFWVVNQRLDINSECLLRALSGSCQAESERLLFAGEIDNPFGFVIRWFDQDLQGLCSNHRTDIALSLPKSGTEWSRMNVERLKPSKSKHWRTRLNIHDESRLLLSRTRCVDPQDFEHHFACGGPTNIFSQPDNWQRLIRFNLPYVTSLENSLAACVSWV